MCQSSTRDDRRDRDRGERGDRDRERTRRRSRSPGHRSSRRDYEVDTYSSSRDYREREREERYSGRGDRGDRRGERGEREWDRDRGARGDRGGRDDRPPRRERGDRELFDDRRGGGRRDRGDRDTFGGGRGDKRSPSPPPKKPREPTPDLTDVVPILERKRRLTQWDIKPPGYENVTAEQAKLSGMFPLPGAPRQQPMDPSRLQAFMNQPANEAANTALKPSNARQSKRLFVYNIPSSATDDSIAEFFNLQLNGLNVISGVDPCITAQVSQDRTFALCEFKTPEDATVALALDGISMEDSNAMDTSNGASNGASQGLSIRRPKDYIVPAVTDESEAQPGVISNHVPDTQNKLCISHIPIYVEAEQVQELLVAFGELKSFVLVQDTSNGQSRGIAFCEYKDPSTTDDAVNGLNGMELGDGQLKAAKASIGLQQVNSEMSVAAMSMLAGTTDEKLEQGRVLCLLNMVTAEELMDSDEYEGKYNLGELEATEHRLLIAT